jgi:glucokinase
VNLLGVDIGGTKIGLALGDENGGVLACVRRPTEPTGSPREDVARIADEARSLLAQHDLTAADVACVGVSAPGPLDAARERVIRPPNLAGWDDVPLRAMLADALGTRVALENDANAAALAEWRYGAGRGFRDVIYLTASTGVGGGIVLGGRLYRGSGGNAGEIGHSPVEWEGLLCACGQRGCLEAYAGGAAWIQRLAEVTPDDSRVAALAGGREHARPEHVVAAAREGDAFALAEMERYNDYMSRAIAALVFVLAPEVVILGTIPTHAGEELCFAPLRAKVASHVWPQLGGALEIVPSALGDDLPAYAGLCAAIEGLSPG